MIPLTQQERSSIIFFIVVLFVGHSLGIVLKKFPFLYDSIHLIEREVYLTKVNINVATDIELEKIPYIGQYTAETIVEYRKEHGEFTSLEQLKAVRGIKDKNFQKFRKYLEL